MGIDKNVNKFDEPDECGTRSSEVAKQKVRIGKVSANRYSSPVQTLRKWARSRRRGPARRSAYAGAGRGRRRARGAAAAPAAAACGTARARSCRSSWLPPADKRHFY